MNIGFDLDGVLVDWHSALLSELKCFGKVYNSISEIYNSKRNLKFLEFFASLPFLYTRPVPKRADLETLHKIAEKNLIFYITARPEGVKNITLAYLRKYGFPYPDNLILTNSTKSSAINNLEVRLFLDDRPEFIEDILKNCPDCLPVLYSREWNITYPYEHTVNSIQSFYTNYIMVLQD